MKRKTIRHLKMNPLPPPSHTRSEGVQYATGEEHRAITNSSRKNEVDRPKWKRCSVVDVSGGKVKSNAIKNNTA